MLKFWALAGKAAAVKNSKLKAGAKAYLNRDEASFDDIPFTTALPFEAFDVVQKLALLVVERQHHLLLDFVVRASLKFLS